MNEAVAMFLQEDEKWLELLDSCTFRAREGDVTIIRLMVGKLNQETDAKPIFNRHQNFQILPNDLIDSVDRHIVAAVLLWRF